MRAPAELAALFAGLGLVPLSPALVATHVGLTWQLVALTVVWAVSWYVWLWVRVREEER